MSAMRSHASAMAAILMWLFGVSTMADAAPPPVPFHGWWDGLATPAHVLTLQSDTLFTSNSATVSHVGQVALRAISQTIHACSGEVEIVGYTDAVGTSSYNEYLSLRRARSVAMQLTSDGASSTRLTVRGRGEEFPVAPNDTAWGRSLNRRVVIEVTTSSNSEGCNL